MRVFHFLPIAAFCLMTASCNTGKQQAELTAGIQLANLDTAAHPVFGDWLKEDIRKYGLQLEPDYRAWENPIGGSDNGSFAKVGIPIIWYHTDGHPDYHQPSDHADRLNWDKVVEITKASFLNMWKMANEKSF